jgi:ubiquinone/menaquinone biosynthesis C-methylase UbiE
MKQNSKIQSRVDEDTVIKNQMEKMVDTYDLYMKRITLGRENTLREMTIDLAQVKPGDSVLEVGCATGTLALAAKRKAGPSGKVFGIDIIPGMIDRSQRKAAQSNLEVTFQLGSIENIPFPENYFDVVMCSFMIFHMSEKVRRKGIAEIYRVLKPNGGLLVLDLGLPAYGVSRMIAKVLLGFMLKHDVKELKPVMESTGFSAVQISKAKYRVFGFSLLSYIIGSK